MGKKIRIKYGLCMIENLRADYFSENWIKIQNDIYILQTFLFKLWHREHDICKYSPSLLHDIRYLLWDIIHNDLPSTRRKMTEHLRVEKLSRYRRDRYEATKLKKIGWSHPRVWNFLWDCKLERHAFFGRFFGVFYDSATVYAKSYL